MSCISSVAPAAVLFVFFALAPTDLRSQSVDEFDALDLIEVSDDGATTVYPASYFAQYNPLSLNDMLQRIPGASISDSVAGQERRGLRGNEDAILINGQQITGKDSGGASALQRIAANQVDRIEIIRGSSSEVQSTTQRIINVILLENSGDTFSFTLASPSYTGDNSIRPVVSLTYASNDIDRNYSIAFNINPIYRPWERTKVTADPDGTVLLSSSEQEQADSGSGSLTGRYEQSFDSGSRLQLNTLARWKNGDRERREVIRDPNLPVGFDQLSDILEDDHKDTYTGEISADYSFPLNEKSTVTLLGLFNWEEENRERDVLDLEPLDEPVLVRQDRLDTNTESILRATYDRTLSPALGLQVGAEGALNTQKTTFDLATRVNGELVPFPIFNSDGKVTEYRGEGFSTLRWKLSDTIEAEFGLAAEISRITQNSVDVQSARSLFFVKPNFNVYWDVTPRNKLFFSVVRDVGQLNFNSFVAQITSTDQELEAGNPGLKPVKSWDYEVGLEHRLASGAGVLSGRLFYRDVQDARGRVTFNGLVSQFGNIGDGEEYGADVEVSLDFSRLGWWDGVLTADYLRRKTSVVDPFDNVSRPFGFTPDWTTSIEYRHEVDTLIDGHVSFNFSQFGARFVNDIDKLDRLKEGGSLTISVEHRLTDNLRINLSTNNFLDRKITRERRNLVFAPDGSRTLASTRTDRSQWGRIFNLFIRGTF